MLKIKLIEKWAKDNEYNFRKWNDHENVYLLLKDLQLKENYVHQKIIVNCNEMEIISTIDFVGGANSRNDLDELYIPLNRVKKDAKELAEYIKCSLQERRIIWN